MLEIPLSDGFGPEIVRCPPLLFNIEFTSKITAAVAELWKDAVFSKDYTGDHLATIVWRNPGLAPREIHLRWESLHAVNATDRPTGMPQYVCYVDVRGLASKGGPLFYVQLLPDGGPNANHIGATNLWDSNQTVVRNTENLARIIATCGRRYLDDVHGMLPACDSCPYQMSCLAMARGS